MFLWTGLFLGKKYESRGIEGLYGRRGRSKPMEELTELKKLKTENRLLKAQAKQQQMEIDFKKNSMPSRGGDTEILTASGALYCAYRGTP